MLVFDNEKEETLYTKIKVMGIGGGGSNAVSHMVRKNLKGALTIAANTDLQALNSSLAHVKIQLGAALTRGLGAGGDPEVGKKAMEESADEVRKALKGADMVFLTAGMGGGTGTGGIPIAAQISKDLGALTIAVVTKPFRFEGIPRIKKAEEGLRNLRDKVDTLLVIPNDRIIEISEKELPIKEAFAMADEVLYQAVKGIISIINQKGIINIDFADIRTIMQEGKGEAIMGTGMGSGEDRAKEAAREAIFSPLLDGVSIQGAKGIVTFITGGESLTLKEVEEAVSLILEEASKDSKEPDLVFGYAVDPSLGDKVQITVIATGISKQFFNWEEESPEATQSEDISVPAYLRKQRDKPAFLRWHKPQEEKE
ncbi:MAG: cell division protein FtsZ [Candidatus Hydrothermota bacterium]|nr:MAG: cell division protein FtsZ [Candidatus Hydrothermae bacterium]RKZ04296.1 MAG: cell division protein FtsZ [Candidatus Hydrothermae bacterium]